MADVKALERHLHRLSSEVVQQGSEEIWSPVESTSRDLADALRTKDGPVDNHTILGQTPLPQSIKSLLTCALRDSPIPYGDRAGAVLELFRVAANFCIDNNENRSLLLDAGVIQVVLSLLEAYNDKITAAPSQSISFSLLELKTLRTALGALLNASLGFDEVKNRLNSLEAAQTVLKLVTSVYRVGAWSEVRTDATGNVSEEWELRRMISSWGWRLVSELRNVKEEAVQIFNPDVLPLLTPPLAAYIPPYNSDASTSFFSGTPSFASLVETDFDILEGACTLIESLTLDVEDIRLALARGLYFPAEHGGVPCLSVIMDFVERGDYPPAWRDPGVFDNAERARKEKEFGMCKAALVKAIVEVAGEEKNADVLWDDSEEEKPGGRFVYRMVNWIKSYADYPASGDNTEQMHGLRDDLVISASLSLGNLSRRESCATALLSPPYSLAPVIASPLFLSPGTDIKLQHGILGLLKFLAQSAGISKVIRGALENAGIIQGLTKSGVWDERTDVMTDVVQLNAIGIVKHLCSADIEHTFALVLPPSDSSTPSGLAQILALVKRSDSVSVKSEGSRVLVNVIKSLWSVESTSTQTEEPQPSERQQKREAATKLVLTQESADVLATLLARSGRYPILVNESIVALTLLSMHKDGGTLVLKSLTKSTSSTILGPPSEPSSASPTSDLSSPIVTTPPTRTKLHVPRHALDMLIFVLRNVDNPVNFPVEVRINVCSLLIQLAKNTSGEELSKTKDAVQPTLEKVMNGLQAGKEDMLRNAIQKVLAAWA